MMTESVHSDRALRPPCNKGQYAKLLQYELLAQLPLSVNLDFSNPSDSRTTTEQRRRESLASNYEGYG
jgi:hypothetical protein